MKTTYREIYVNNPSFWEKHSPELNCLVWSDNLEHAVFLIDDEVHLCSRFVWNQTSKYILYFVLRKARDRKGVGFRRTQIRQNSTGKQ